MQIIFVEKRHRRTIFPSVHTQKQDHEYLVYSNLARRKSQKPSKTKLGLVAEFKAQVEKKLKSNLVSDNKFNVQSAC